MYENLYETITQNLVDYGYIIINDALDTSLVKNLQDLALQNQSYKQAGISSTTKLHLDDTKRRDKTKWLDEDTAAQSRYLHIMQELQNYLNHSLYLGLTYYESHFALYESDDFYEKHLDSFSKSKNRIVTSVYYLNETWEQEDGGELIIYNKENKHIKTVSPKSDTLVLFLSEKFPHEVLISKKKRYSIAGWFRVDK